MEQNAQETGVPSMEQAPKFSDYISSIEAELKRTDDLLELSFKDKAPFGAPSTTTLIRKQAYLHNTLIAMERTVIEMGIDLIKKHEKGISEDEIRNRLVDSQIKEGREHMIVRAAVLSKPLSDVKESFKKLTDTLESEYSAFSIEDRTRGNSAEPTKAEDLGNYLKHRDNIASEIEGFLK